MVKAAQEAQGMDLFLFHSMSYYEEFPLPTPSHSLDPGWEANPHRRIICHGNAASYWPSTNNSFP